MLYNENNFLDRCTEKVLVALKKKSEAESFLHMCNLDCSLFTVAPRLRRQAEGTTLLFVTSVARQQVAPTSRSLGAAVSEPLRLFRGLPSLPRTQAPPPTIHGRREGGWEEAGGSRDRQQRSLQSRIWQAGKCTSVDAA